MKEALKQLKSAQFGAESVLRTFLPYKQQQQNSTALCAAIKNWDALRALLWMHYSTLPSSTCQLTDPNLPIY